MERLRQHASLQLCYTPFEHLDSNQFFKIIFNYCRSLYLHFDDIKVDHDVLSSHIAAFAGTRLCSKDADENYSIAGFSVIRNDQNEKKSK